ncbi:MAG TPA: hypothetical protein VEA41_20185 [Salinarimonas sp.]|nr:hypothetical protein [Salinarimonas sp.]
MSGKTRCRMHGGAKGSGAPKGKANGRYMHGQFTAEAMQMRRQLRGMMRRIRAELKTI